MSREVGRMHVESREVRRVQVEQHLVTSAWRGPSSIGGQTQQPAAFVLHVGGVEGFSLVSYSRQKVLLTWRGVFLLRKG